MVFLWREQTGLAPVSATATDVTAAATAAIDIADEIENYYV